jgi:heme-degrading monooxygenase HmoA
LGRFLIDALLGGAVYRTITGMHCIAYVYDVDPAFAGQFEETYGPTGTWAQFFSGGAGYLGTELFRDATRPGRYLVIDQWDSSVSAGTFLAESATDYARRSAETTPMYRRETRIGAFDEC